MGTFQNCFGLELALIGSVWNYEGMVLHSLSAPIVCFFHARGRIFEPRIGCWIPRSIVWPPGTFLGSKMGSERGGVATESFRGGNSGEFPRPKCILWSIGSIWAGYFAKNLVFVIYFTGIYHFPGKLGRVPACYLGHRLVPLWAIA